MAAIPQFEPFDIHADAAIAQRWKKWIKRLENLFVAAEITDKKRQRALLLYYSGDEVQEIFDTLPETGDDFAKAKEKLNAYFDPKQNVEYEIYKFRQAKQNIGEKMDAFHARLRQLASTCEFANMDHEIKSQIIQSCLSQRLRRKALKDSKITLASLLDEARALEISEAQAKDIESTSTVNAVHTPTTKDPRKDSHKKCFNCGGEWPHQTKPCPAKTRKCNSCHRYGHYAQFCRSSANSSTKPRKNKRNGKRNHSVKVNQVDEETGTRDSPTTAVSSSSDDEYTFTVNASTKVKPPVISLKVNGIDCDFLVDSGASVNIVNTDVQQKLKVKLQPYDSNVYAYNSSTPLQVLGKFSAVVASKHKSISAEFIVVNDKTSLLGYTTATNLQVLKVVNEVSPKADIFTLYPGLFSDLGKMRDLQVKLHINEGMKPVTQTHRRIPFRKRKQLDKCLESLVNEDIIEPADGPTPWVSPIIMVPKPKQPGGIRLCVDMREANNAIERERHLMPTLDEVIHDLNGATVFSKLDLNQGYHQLELHPESRNITTFSTHKGLFRYKRLSFGINAAAEKFQDVISTAISDIPNSKNISDDIIIYGVNREEHDKALHAVLNRFSELNLTLNKAKCKFYMPSIEFFGMVFSAQGISPDPAKVEAVKKANPPSSVSEVRSLLGMTNYVSRFIQNYADIVAPLRELTHKDVKFQWEEVHQQALDKLKDSLTSNDVMAYFDLNKETVLLVDASPFGLGAVLTQDGKVLAYASKALSSVEKRYSQIEREALAIAWGCHHFRMYLLGGHFTVVTDHKPLLTIFNSATSQASARIENWRLKLQSFDFQVVYSKGETNPADYISRHLQGSEECNYVSKSAEKYVNFVVSQATPKALSKEEIIEATANDATLQKVMELISSGRWDDLKPEDGDVSTLRIFANLQNELTSLDGKILLRGSRLVIPDALQKRVVQLAHEGHQGLVKTRSLLRSKVWFPRIDSLTDSIVKNCGPCQVATPQSVREPLKMTPLPRGPWEKVSIDFAEVAGQYVLVVIDDYSRFPEVDVVHSTSAKAVIPKLDRMFAAYGVPHVIKSDNGPPFNGNEFSQFADYLGFKHRKVTPLWPEANGEVERFMRTFGKVLRTSTNWKQSMFSFLRNYRATPHCTTGVAPATALFGRPIRVKLPDTIKLPSGNPFDPNDMREKDALQKQKMKKYAEDRRNIRECDIKVGDTVIVKQPKKEKLSTPFHPSPLKAVEKFHSMITAENEERRVTRNSSHFKELSTDPDSNSPEEPMTKVGTEPACATRRSTRIARPPQRLIEEM